jgi:presenilin-like A22 family membrane protease
LSASPETKRKTSLEPVLWSCLLYILGLLFLFYYLYPRVSDFIATNNISVPETSIWPILIYFFSVVVVMGVVLYFIPISKLKMLLRMLFALLYGWGTFVVLGLVLPFWVVLPLAIAVGVLWFFFPLVWLQNILLLMTLVAVGTVFGTLVKPWTVVWVMLAISVYDVVAVVAGYMMWMAKKLSQSDSLPAFVLPKKAGDWNLNLKGSTVNKLFDDENAERDFSLLGGGDLGFPLVFVASVITAYGVGDGFVVAIASVIGLLFAYFLQIYVLKGKPLPALPPICFVAFLGFILVRYII